MYYCKQKKLFTLKKRQKKKILLTKKRTYIHQKKYISNKTKNRKKKP